jgi:hypothetical protein
VIVTIAKVLATRFSRREILPIVLILFDETSEILIRGTSSLLLFFSFDSILSKDPDSCSFSTPLFALVVDNSMKIDEILPMSFEPYFLFNSFCFTCEPIFCLDFCIKKLQKI